MSRSVARTLHVLVALVCAGGSRLARGGELLEFPTGKLLGGAQATNTDSAAAAMGNPAIAGVLAQSQIEGGAGLYQSTSTTIGYAGAAPVKRTSAGVDALALYGGAVYKLTPRLGIGAVVVPPGLGTTVKVAALPLYLLGQLYTVDVSAKITTGAIAQLTAGYRLTPTLALGLNASRLGGNAVGSAASTGTAAPLANFKVDLARTVVGFGLLFKPAEGLDLGATVTLMQHVTLSQAIDVSLLGDQGGAPIQSVSDVTQALPSILLGAGARLTPRVRVMVDGQYTRADPARTQYSLVERRDKPLDSYDTFAVRAGVSIEVKSREYFLLGARYEPSAVGPGGVGPGSKSGYGFFQTMPALIGQDLAPYYGFSAGIELGMGDDQAARSGRRHRSGARGPVSWSLLVGVVYQTASIGVDKAGELPATYEQTRLLVPAGVRVAL